MARSTAKPGQPSQLKSTQKSKAGVRKNRRRHANPSRARKSKSPSAYNYAPLQRADSIRLLTLHPGDFISPLRISLAEVRSQDDHAYEALSYTWAMEDGDCRRSSQIRCGDTRIWVTKNCELALRYLRREDSNRVLWVDAICINQKDDKERGHQVGMMKKLFSKATEVLIWLGEASKEVGVWSQGSPFAEARASEATTPCPTTASEQCSGIPNVGNDLHDDSEARSSVSTLFMAFLEKMTAEVRQLRKAGRDPKSSLLYQELLALIYDSSGIGVENGISRGFTDIIRRRWWSRVWVVQEAAMARSATLVCSTQSTNYRNFFDWFQLLLSDRDPRISIIRGKFNYFGTSSKHLRAVDCAWRIAKDPEQLSNFMEVLSRVRNLTASDPRDNIFGILGLLDNFSSLLPLPDYSKTTTEIFTNVTKSFLEQKKSLSILMNVITDTPVLDHPSWVPYIIKWSKPDIIRYEYWVKVHFKPPETQQQYS